MDTQQILLELSELLRRYYNGSFSEMVCEYIRTTGMPSQDVEELLKDVKGYPQEGVKRVKNLLLYQMRKYQYLFT